MKYITSFMTYLYMTTLRFGNVIPHHLWDTNRTKLNANKEHRYYMHQIKQTITKYAI